MMKLFNEKIISHNLIFHFYYFGRPSYFYRVGLNDEGTKG